MRRTTIQLDEETRRNLERMKVERGVRTYAEVIRSLVKETKSIERGERGSLPKLESFRREKLDRLDR